MLEETNRRELASVLYYDDEFILSPEEWVELMSEKEEHRLACDLPFVQLCANLLRRNISLIVIKQKDIKKPQQDSEKEGESENELQDENMFFTIFANESNKKEPLTMLYFPPGQFKAEGHFQSITRKCIDVTVLKKANEMEIKKLHQYEEEEGITNQDDEDVDDLNDDFNITEFNTKGNSFNQVTTITPQDPASTIIVNESKEKMTKNLKRGGPTYEIAPGEGRKPEEWLREPTFDVDAFPHLYPDGKYGIEYEQRPKKITPTKFFAQRILNKNTQFAEDPDYIFMAQQYLERYALERQISMSVLNGTVETAKDEGKTKLTPSDDKFSIFQSIPGTPAYWKKFRNEIYARMEQLGPFHLFYTMSCAEMRWHSVLSEVFRSIGKGKIQVHYELNDGDWDGTAETIKIWHVNEKGQREKFDGVWEKDLSSYKIWYFKSKKITMTDFLKDHFVLITRIFDKRVKDFHTEVMKKKGIVNYAYRIEFQMRGLPHIHGVAWIDKDQIKDCLGEDGLFRTDDEGEEHLIKLINEWTSCSLYTDDEMQDLVRSTNMHHHTKSCRKYGTDCRYDFPRLFSRKTVIAKEPSNKTPEELKRMFEMQTAIFKKVKEGYDKIDENDTQYDISDDKIREFLTEQCGLTQDDAINA